MRLYISNIRAISKGLETTEQWSEWGKNTVIPKDNLVLDMKNIPPILRRRCSIVSKIAL